jgi:hypothetical protein
MYNDHKSPDLLQGDVISELSYPVFSDISLSISRSSGKPEFGGRVSIKTNFICIVSHSCDLVIHAKGPKRPALLFCPLVKVPDYIRQASHRYDALRQNTVDPGKPQFINLFWFRQEDPLPDDLVIDLSTMQPLPINTVTALCRKKTLELDDKHRMLLQTKLMHHFGRPEQVAVGE